MPVARLLTGLVLLPVFISALLYLPATWWILVLLAIMLVASLEWGTLSGYSRGGAWVFAVATVASASALSLLPAGTGNALSMHWVLWAAAVFWLVLVPSWLAARLRLRGRAVLAVAGWLVLVPTHFALSALQSAPAVLLMLLGVVWIADSAAYFAGRRFGRNRLAPEISPGKTWEGVAGAALAVTVYYAVLYALFADLQPLLSDTGGPILFAIVMILSVEGDLFESWIKRQAGAKDSGRLLPGHGGVLDRIDGLTASMPLAALWCHAFGACSTA